MCNFTLNWYKMPVPQRVNFLVEGFLEQAFRPVPQRERVHLYGGRFLLGWGREPAPSINLGVFFFQ